MTLAASDLGFGRGGRAIGCVEALALAPGEVFCLLGPNGGGKTTLLKTLVGLLAPVSGTVAWQGRQLSSLPAAERARAIGFVPQATPVTFAYSVLDVVLMGRAAHIRPFAAPSRRDRDVAMGVLGELGIAALAGRAFPELSGGERQMVLIARALAQQASVLVLDEPTASLDLANQMEVLSVILRLASRGIAVAFSTHDPDHALAAAGRVGLLGAGRLRALDVPERAITRASLTDLYGVVVDVVYERGAGRRICVPSFSRPDGRQA